MNTERRGTSQHQARYAMIIDLDRCTGCGACVVACAVENNCAPAPDRTSDRTGVTWTRVYQASNGFDFPNSDSVFIPMMCQQCDHHPPCESVCPQKAVEYDQNTGIVGQIPARCLGCRYCMAACPFHARSFNWWDPVWPKGMERALSPHVSTRMRGTVEKCNFCHHRLQIAKEQAAQEGSTAFRQQEYQPACAEACPAQAIIFGDLNNPEETIAREKEGENVFRFLASLRTEPKVFYRSRRAWVRAMAERNLHG